MQGWTLPTTVTVGGKPYAVHTDYRDILDIIDHLQNTDDRVQLCRERSRPFRGFAVDAITGFTAKRRAHAHTMNS